MEVFDPVFVVANFLKEVCLVGCVLFSLRINESIRYMSVDRGMEAAHEIVKQSFVRAGFCLVENQVQHLLVSAATVLSYSGALAFVVVAVGILPGYGLAIFLGLDVGPSW